MKTLTFLSDGIARHTLTFETDAGGETLVHGLPIVKAGVWNGEPYTAEFLRDVVANTNAGMRGTENFLPISELHPSRDKETKAWIEGLRFDEATQSVLADPVRVADPSVVDKLRNKQYRYTSAETMIADKRMVGAAFVPNPGCKGLVFSLSEQPVNSGDFDNVHLLSLGNLSASAVQEKALEILRAMPQYQGQDSDGPGYDFVEDLFEGFLVYERDNSHFRHSYTVTGDTVAVDPAGEEVTETWSPVAPVSQNSAHSATGGTTMSKLTDWLQEHVPGFKPTPEQVTALADAARAETAGDPPAPTPAELSDPRVAQVMQTNAELTAKLAEQEKQIATLAAARRTDEVSTYVDRLVTSGKLAPAKRQTAFAVLSAHWGETVHVLDDKGADVEKPLADVLGDMFTSVHGKPALAFTGPEGTDIEAARELSDEDAKALHEAHGHKIKTA
jgi:hypothetical protein